MALICQVPQAHGCLLNMVLVCHIPRASDMGMLVPSYSARTRETSLSTLGENSWAWPLALSSALAATLSGESPVDTVGGKNQSQRSSL